MKTFSPLVRLVDQPAAARRGGKSAQAFRTISEVAQELDVPQHVLRFWETKFTQIKPLKRGGGRRYYRPDDVTLLRGIHKLLHQDGYTIKGVQRLLREASRPGAVRSAEEGAGINGVGINGVGPTEADAAEAAEPRNYSMLDLFDEVAEGVADEADVVPLLPVLSSEKRAMLKSVLGELEELRALIPPRPRSLAS